MSHSNHQNACKSNTSMCHSLTGHLCILVPEAEQLHRYLPLVVVTVVAVMVVAVAVVVVVVVVWPDCFCDSIFDIAASLSVSVTLIKVHVADVASDALPDKQLRL
eukprot:479136-Amphidinium_carterae.1